MNTDKTSEVLATAFAAYRINKGYPVTHVDPVKNNHCSIKI